MSNSKYKSQKNKFIVYIIVTFIISVVMIYLGWKYRLPIKNNGVVTRASLFNAEFLVGIGLLVASILFTVLLFWIDNKVKSSFKKQNDY
jgi:multisubunit Na+/H+ antiporter MnhB subunit